MDKVNDILKRDFSQIFDHINDSANVDFCPECESEIDENGRCKVQCNKAQSDNLVD